MNKFNKLYEAIMHEGILPSDSAVSKLYKTAREYKAAKVKIDKNTTYVLKFDSREGGFKVYDLDDNDVTMDLGMGTGLNTRKLAQAKKDLRDWFKN